ncbi:hypothetical protein [Streptosporangium pseudovulgare]|uniref:Uncharacterized protein n=1 Tax=Streptosporangium pseudovulgare TaxID=35765 RepID=A0ABQ2QGW1_9ACTN|nr:hypothetical protein [Streptosporangium pseudovulgare]GGP79404.1 hypothetical protein GCM10010140_04870 [Streptosporangium pseudovulgare]
MKLVNGVTDRIISLLGRKATAHATPARGSCVAGCGGDGVWTGAKADGGRRPCC